MAEWTEEERLKIWNKADIEGSLDPAVWRKDQYGALIRWEMYGLKRVRESAGWVIDQEKPENGAGDIINRAKAVQWFNFENSRDGKAFGQVYAKRKD